MSFELAKINMIKHQIRSFGVPFNKIIELMDEIPREKFIDKNKKSLAYTDIDVPLDNGEIMLSPDKVARLLNSLNLKETDSILEFSTSNGYITALLSKLCKIVETTESNSKIIEDTKKRLKSFDIYNIKYHTFDISEDVIAKQYDCILITKPIKNIPNHIFEAVKKNGKVFAFIDNDVFSTAVVLSFDGNQWLQSDLFDVYNCVNPKQQNNSFIF